MICTRKAISMKICHVKRRLQPSSSCSFVIIGLVAFFSISANASGMFMNTLRRRLQLIEKGLYGTKNFTRVPIPFEVPIPPLKETTNLEELDEMYSLCNSIDIRELTIRQFQELFDTGRLTSVDLTNCYLERIHQMNQILKVVIEINPDAIGAAMRADFERSDGNGNYSLMHGIPIIIKGNIATNDLVDTTAGSLALIGIRPKNYADVMQTLRKSGAIILGKANLSEFANFRGTNIPDGWSGQGGQTRNAYNLNASPSGSSSGSAQSVAANLAVVSVGTETDGSLMSPASVAGICTIKPTLGAPSVHGVIPISHNQDSVGPMGRTVMDVAILLDAMLPMGRYMNRLLNPTLRNDKFRIGVLRQPFWNSSAFNSSSLEFQLPQLENTLNLMRNAGEFEIIDPVEYPLELLTDISGLKELIVLTHDFKHEFNEYLNNEVIGPFPIPGLHTNTSFRRIKSLKDVIQFNIDNPSPEGYNQVLLEMSEATDGLQNSTYIEARDSNRKAASDLLDYVLTRYNVHAVVTPSDNWFHDILDLRLENAPVVGFSVAAIAGYPSLNIPAGIGLMGVPFGITLMGLPHTESTLLDIALVVEQLDKKRQSPQFLT